MTVRAPRTPARVETVAFNPNDSKDGTKSAASSTSAVFLPAERADWFVRRFKDSDAAALRNRIATVRPATLRAPWTDWNDGYPSRSDEPFRWEIWLRRTDGREIRRFREFADLAGFHAGETH